MSDTAVLTAPPEVSKALRTANAMYALVEDYEIDSPEMFIAAGNELQTLQAKYKEIEGQRVFGKAPMLEAIRRHDAFFKAPLDRLGDAINTMKSRMLTFQNAERDRQAAIARQQEADARRERERLAAIAREAEAEERRALALAADTKRKADEAAAHARNAGDEAAAQAAEETARVVEEAAITTAQNCAAAVESITAEIELADVAAPIVLAQTRANGISSRQVWKAQVVDLRALVTAAAAALENGDTTLLGYLMANEKALGLTAKALKAQARIPGVRIYAEDTMAVRTK